MDLTTGALGSLLPKLVKLLKEEYKLQKGVKKDVKFLERELRSVHAALSKVADVPPDQLDELVKIWADDVRDLSYDMEDAADSFLMWDLLTKGKTRHKIAGDSKDIKVRVKEVADRYMVDGIAANPAVTTSIDPRLLALYKENQGIVGTEEARDELIKRLTDGDVVSKHQLNILSIFGFGGLGKTTLAKEVYERLQAQYACKAFVVVGRNPDPKKIFKDILLDLDDQKYMNFNLATLDERQLINELREQLLNKRYFIVIDDIWDTKTWGIIRCAFMDNDCGSRIITTTRIFEVAAKAGDVYRIKPLSPEKSEELFYTRLSGDKRHNEDVENMRKILLYSYYDIPSYLRTCLLHLSIYLEDYQVCREELIWKWVAEGFVREELDMSPFEVGDKYFNELINRSMIRPVQNIPHANVFGCCVHDMVLDMICSLSKEENFVSILGTNEQCNSLQGNVRRLAIQNIVSDKHGLLANTRTQQFRSLNATLCVIGAMLPLEKFQALRVLDFVLCSYADGHTYLLRHLGKLLQLRYLGLEASRIQELPDEIGNLKFLQTLNIANTEIRELPRGIRRLRQFKCLGMLFCSVEVPDWMGNLTSLEDLSVANVSQSPNFVKELGKLTEMRRLRIAIGELGEESWKCKAFVQSLEKLQKIQELHIWSTEEVDLETHVPSRKLRDLVLDTSSSKLPMWINSSLLPHLTYLCASLKAVKEQDIDILGRFLELLTMQLIIKASDGGGYNPPLQCSGGAFPKLKYCETPAPLLALKGAMPRVESVNFQVCVRPLLDSNFNFDFGSLGNLPFLEKVIVQIICTGADAREVEESEAAVRRTVQVHPNRPFLSLTRDGITYASSLLLITLMFY
ncbi:hypothetical protein ACQ4PT_004536 [Festuca glaucescens]